MKQLTNRDCGKNRMHTYGQHRGGFFKKNHALSFVYFACVLGFFSACQNSTAPTAGIPQGKNNQFKKSTLDSKVSATEFSSIVRSAPSLSLENLQESSFSQEERHQWPAGFSLSVLKKLLAQKKWSQASSYINKAINASHRVASLHIINGLVYEAIACQGGSSNLYKPLPSVAYQTAYNINPSGESAYLLGVSLLREKKYKAAHEHLADAVNFDASNTSALYALAYSAYYAGNFGVAYGAIKRAAILEKNNPVFLRSAAIVAAACDDKKAAIEYWDRYRAIVGEGEKDTIFIKERIQELLSTSSKWCKAVDEDSAEGIAGRRSSDLQTFLSNAQAASAANQEEKDSNLALVFDLNLLRFSKTEASQMGQNIFESLAVTLAFSGGGTKTTGWTNGVVSDGPTKHRALSFTCTQPVLSYFMNFMNARSQVIEVVARPTIYALSGKSAFFAQGDQIQGAAVSPIGGGTLSTVDAGTKVEIFVQKVYKDGTVILKVVVDGKLFNNLPNTSLGIADQMISLTGSTVETTVKAKLGETVMISGIDSVVKTSNESGVPGLKNIPVVNLFTSSKTKSVDHRTTIYLITPRALDPKISFPSAECVRSARKLRESGVFTDLGLPNAVMIAENLNHLLQPNDMVLPDQAHGF